MPRYSIDVPIARSVIRLIGAVVMQAGALHAQKPVVIGETLEFRSNILAEDRQLFIATPPDYDGSAEAYPVLYLLDAETHFRHASAATEFLASADRIPELIVVGIASGSRQQRTRDLTPETSAEIDRRFNPVHGGAANFLAFLTDELMPMVEKKYRTRPYRILAGHSLGGLFTAYALSRKPAAFQAYLAIDPSLSWNEGRVIDRIGQVLARTESLRADFFVAAAYSGNPSDRRARELAELLSAKAPAGFRSHFDSMAQQTHMSIPLPALHRGLEVIFDGWYLTHPLELFEKGGIEAIHKHFREGGQRYGYARTTSPFIVSMVVAELIWKGNLEAAARVLLHDEEKYPAPWNQLDALARAFAKQGDKERAIRFYRASLKANPGNDWAKRQLQEMGVKPDQDRH